MIKEIQDFMSIDPCRMEARPEKKRNTGSKSVSKTESLEFVRKLRGS
jgi:hypothetical protein